MTEIVGVQGPGIPAKRDALWFDGLVMYQADDIINGFTGENELASQLRFLCEHNIIRPAPGVIELGDEWPESQAIQDCFKQDADVRTKLDRINSFLAKVGVDNLTPHQESKVLKTAVPLAEEYRRLEALREELVVRLICIELRSDTKIEPYGLLCTPPQFRTEASVNATVADIVLAALPQPDESVSWERIVEFRSDSDACAKLLQLRRWIRNFIRDNREPNELSDELDYMIHSYKKYMDIHKLKYKMGRWRTLLTISADLVENLAKFRLRDAVDALFSVYDRKVQLMEAELSAPGKEAAFIVEAHERFGHKESINSRQ